MPQIAKAPSANNMPGFMKMVCMIAGSRNAIWENYRSYLGKALVLDLPVRARCMLEVLPIRSNHVHIDGRKHELRSLRECGDQGGTGSGCAGGRECRSGAEDGQGGVGCTA